MKLNIGCGYNYLTGYINTDSSADSLADRRMEAHSLDFDDASAGEIRASQLIEHLGFFKTRYFLAECRRVLEPGGLLVLETPLIEKTFEIFMKGGRAEKEAALGWVYGSETAGMNHLYCFPEDLLKELAEAAGFEFRGAEYFDHQPARPALRLTLAKAADESADFEAAFRRALTLRKAVLSGEEYAAAEQEKLIRACMAPAIFNDNKKVLELALYQPDLAAAFFSVRSARENGAGVFLKAAERLSKTGFTARLYQALKERPLEEKQRAAFDTALEAGRSVLKKALAGPRPFGPRTEADVLTLTPIGAGDEPKRRGGSAEPAPGPGAAGCPPIFSFEMARLHSRKVFCAGLKAYGLNAFSEAGAFFTDALAFYRDDPAAWLQLGRNFKALGDAGKAVPAYDKALKLFKELGPSGTGMAAALKKEIAPLQQG